MRTAAMLAAVFVSGCNNLLGIGDIHPVGDAAPDRPPDTVVGHATITHVLMTQQTLDSPVDLSSYEIRAYLPDPSQGSGFRVVNGTGDKNGNVLVAGVPDGMTYYLKMTDLTRPTPLAIYYVTDRHDLDLGLVTVGRPDAVAATLQTQVTLNLGNMRAWSNADALVVDSFGNGSERFIFKDGTNDANVLNMPVAGATSLAITFDWLSGYTYDNTAPRLVDAAKMDDIRATHTVGSSISDATNHGYTKSAVADVFTATDVSMTDGHAVSVAGAFEPVAQTGMQSLALSLSLFTPAFVDGGHYFNSDFSCVRLKNWAVQYGNFIGPGLITIAGPLATASGSASFAATPYGDPYPASWQSMMACTISHYRLLKVPGATRTWRTVARMTQAQPAKDDFSAGVYVHPPENVMVAGIPALAGGAAPFDGSHPVTVSWDSQPNVGHYSIGVFHVTINVNATQLTQVGVLHTATTSIDIPAEILIKGDFYLLNVIAIRDPNSYALGHLIRRGFPTGTGAGVTGLMRLSSACGNGVPDPGELCDTGGNSMTCDADCSPAVCGDGFVNAAANEACDNITDSPTCDSDCTAPVCGDGHWNRTVEQCDDGNTVSGDGCDASCRLEHCGNNAVDAFEDCDDGNHVNGDGCDAFCRQE